MTSLQLAETAAKDPGRKHLEECGRMNGRPVGQVVDEALACGAEGCQDAANFFADLSIALATAVPIDVAVADEVLIRSTREVEDEYRTLDRPTRQKPWLPAGICPPGSNH